MSRRIVYLCWPPTEIAGGIKTRFRHVELLRAAGIDAVIAAEKPQAPQWFESSAPIIDLASQIERHRDVLVFPENHLGMFQRFADWPNPKIVYCQNQHMIFRGVAERGGYDAYGVTHLLCTGIAAVEFCQRRCRSLQVDYVPHFIDHGLFRPPEEASQLQIVTIPRKRMLELHCVRDLFWAENPHWQSIPWIVLQGAKLADVAQAMRQSSIFLALNGFESFGNIPLEAMASGCLVAGFLGGGGEEYSAKLNGYWAREDDCLDCASQLAAAVTTASAGGTLYHQQLEAGYATASRYTAERTAPLLIQYWRQFSEA